MLPIFRQSVPDALAPLLQLAHTRHAADRRMWLDELRRDAPGIVMRFGAILAQEVVAGVVDIPRERAAGLAAAPRTASIASDAWTTSAA